MKRMLLKTSEIKPVFIDCVFDVLSLGAFKIIYLHIYSCQTKTILNIYSTGQIQDHPKAS